jgi:hypothetical protein
MGWLDALERRARDAVGSVPVAPVPARQPAKPPPKADIKAVSVQTAAPLGSSPGAITVGYYSVQDDVVVMHDESGKPTGKRMPAGEDPRQVAYLITQESWKADKPDFNRPLNYQPLGIA